MKLQWTKQHTKALLYVCGTCLAAIPLFFLIIRPESWTRPLGGLLRALGPALYGFVIAYLLWPLVRWLEKKPVALLLRKKSRPKTARGIAVLLAFLILAALLSLFVGMIVPQIGASYKDLQSKADGYLDALNERLSAPLSRFAGSGGITFSREELIGYVGDAIDSSFAYISQAFSALLTASTRLVGLLADMALSLLFAALFLAGKERIFAKLRTLAEAILPDKIRREVFRWTACTDRVFGGYIVGKLIDGILLTAINFAVFGIAGIPYSPLISLLCGITNLIPYFGPFIGAIPSGLLILVADPGKLVWFIILTLIIQQIEGNLIEPKILGNTVGLDGFAVIVAVTVFGEWFGLVGLFIGLPVFAVLYRIVKEVLEKRLQKKGLPTETDAYFVTQEDAK